MKERNWPAAIRVIQRFRKEGWTYDRIAKHLMEEKYLTVTFRSSWGVGQVWNIARAGDLWIKDQVKGTVFEDEAHYPL